MFTYQMCYFYASKMINRKFIFSILTFLQHGMAIKSVQTYMQPPERPLQYKSKYSMQRSRTGQRYIVYKIKPKERRSETIGI